MENPDLSSNSVGTYRQINISNVDAHSVPNYISNVSLAYVVIDIFTFLLANILPVKCNVGQGDTAFKIRNVELTNVPYYISGTS